MANVVDFPGIPTGGTEEQCQQIWTYLYLLAERLNQTLSHITIDNMGEAEAAALRSISTAVSMRAESSVRTEKSATTISAQLAQSELNMRSMVSRSQRDMAAATAAAKAELTHRVEEVRKLVREAEQKISEAETRISGLGLNIEATDGQVGLLGTEIRALQGRIGTQDERITTAFNQIEALEERVTELEEGEDISGKP